MKVNFKLRISIAFFLITFFVATYIFLLLYRQTVSDYTESLRMNLKSTASFAASTIEAEDVLSISLQEGCEKNPNYKKLLDVLHDVIKMDARIDDAYILVPSGTDYVLRFVINADRAVTPVSCGQEYNIKDIPAMQRAFVEPDADHEVTSDQWGVWLSGYAPIKNDQGDSIAIIGLDVAEKTINSIREVFLQRYLFFMILMLLLAFLMGFFISQWLTRPLDSIIDSMLRVSDGDFSYRLPASSMQEFNRMSQIFNKMSESLVTSMKQLTQTVRSQERMNRELEIAADLQARALPERPPTVADLDISAKYLAAKQVGGDYYDFLAKDEDRLGLVIADATGKGVSGALYMTNSRSIFYIMAGQEDSASAALTKTNETISNRTISHTGMFITMFYAIYDHKTSRLNYSNAGHNPPIVYKVAAKKFEMLNAQGTPLGIMAGQKFGEDSLKLDSGDILILYTDGVVEAKNAQKNMYGTERLLDQVRRLTEKSSHEILEGIWSDVMQFMSGESQHDDITLVVIKKK